jgi:hypothetical protein
MLKKVFFLRGRGLVLAALMTIGLFLSDSQWNTLYDVPFGKSLSVSNEKSVRRDLYLSSDANMLQQQEAKGIISRPRKGRTIAVYVGNGLDDVMQIRRIRELQSYFGRNLYVVTEKDLDNDDWILPPDQVVSPRSNVSLTNTLALNLICCGIERAINWLVENQDYYEFAWVIEDDVLWSNMTDLTDFFESYKGDDTDLLHKNQGMEKQTYNYNVSVWMNHRLVPPYVTEQAQFYPPWRSGLFQFYRISWRFVAALDDWRRNKNNGEWTFFEPLFANFAFRNDTISANLTTNDFINNPVGYKFHLRFRPCFSLEQVYNKSERGGMFHPVKKGDPLADRCLRFVYNSWIADIAETNKSNMD